MRLLARAASLDGCGETQQRGARRPGTEVVFALADAAPLIDQPDRFARQMPAARTRGPSATRTRRAANRAASAPLPNLNGDFRKVGLDQAVTRARRFLYHHSGVTWKGTSGGFGFADVWRERDAGSLEQRTDEAGCWRAEGDLASLRADLDHLKAIEVT